MDSGHVADISFAGKKERNSGDIHHLLFLHTWPPPATKVLVKGQNWGEGRSSGCCSRSSSNPMAAAPASAVLPPSLTSASDPPPLFDGTTRLYVAYVCPYAQRTWIARNFKGLEDKIELVPIDLKDRPAWYKEKVYPTNKVPSLEHNKEVKGESLDLIKFIDTTFDGPSLFPDDSAKQEFAEELFSYADEFNKALYATLTSEGGVKEEAVNALNKIEEALVKFQDGLFFLGQFSLVDISYAPFVERFQIFFSNIKNYDLTDGRPNLSIWIEELNKIQAYTQTKLDPGYLLDHVKQRLGIA